MRRLNAQAIVVPAVTFVARVRLGEGNLTEIERVVLEAIGMGVSQVSTLTALLGLGARPTLDLLYDLWRAGHILVSVGKGQVQLAGKARRLFGENLLAELESAERVVRPVHLVQELLTGAVLPWLGNTRPEGPDSALVPAPMSSMDLRRVSRAELEEVVERELQRERRRMRSDASPQRPLRILETWLEPEQLIQVPTAEFPAVQARRYLSLSADVWIDSDTHRMMFEVVYAPDLPPTLRREMGRALSERAGTDAGLLFYKRLREELERRPVGDVPNCADGAVARLGGAARRLDRVDAGTVAQRHIQLREAFLGALDEIQGAVRAQGQTTLLIGYAEHDAALSALAQAATRQLVIANPWISLEGLLDPSRGTSWWQHLEEALARGVRVVILWGIAEASELPGPVRTALEDLRARFPGLLLCSNRSANLHAKVVVRDAAEAIVSSYNFLQPPRAGDSLELGLRVTGESSEDCPGVVQDLLEWARGRYPEYQARKQIATLPDELGGHAAEPITSPTEPELPDLETAQLDTEARALSLRVWAEQWAGVARRLELDAERLGTGVTLVRSSEHRTALWAALRGASRRLVVLSDKLSVDVVNDRFARAVAARMDAEVPCAFMFRTEGVSDRSEGPSSRLEALVHKVPGLCRIVPARSHAKLLVHDDVLVLGSYNFLSYGADESGPAVRAERAELSVRVHDGALVDRVLDVLEGLSPGTFADLQGRSPRRDAQTLEALPVSLQPLVRALNDTRTGMEALRRWFERSSTPWADLDALQRAGAAPELLQRANLSALAFSSVQDVDGRARWQSVAALWRWSMSDLIGAALLLPDAPPEDALLPPWLVQLGASVQAGKGASALLASPRNADEAAAAVALLVGAALQTAAWSELDRFVLGAGALPDPCRAWVEGVRAWRRATAGSPLDLRLLERSATDATRHREAQAARAVLASAVQDALHVGFTFPLGQHTWALLRQEGHLLAELEASSRENAPERLARFFARHGRAKDTPEQLMDEASWERRDEHGNSRILEPKRRSCLARLNRAWEAGIRWVELALHTQPSDEDGRLLLAARSLRRELESMVDPALFHDAPLTAPALAVVRNLLRSLLLLEAR